MLAAGEDADRAGERARVVAGGLQGLPGALEEQALLGVHELGLPRGEAEEAGVEAARRRPARRRAAT